MRADYLSKCCLDDAVAATRRQPPMHGGASAQPSSDYKQPLSGTELFRSQLQLASSQLSGSLAVRICAVGSPLHVMQRVLWRHHTVT